MEQENDQHRINQALKTQTSLYFYRFFIVFQLLALAIFAYSFNSSELLWTALLMIVLTGSSEMIMRFRYIDPLLRENQRLREELTKLEQHQGK